MLAEDRDAQRELDDWGEVLQDAQCHQRQPDRRRPEQQEGDGGGDTGGGEQHRVPGIVAEGQVRSGHTQHDEVGQRERGLEAGLDRERGNGCHPGRLANQAVHPEGEGQHQRDPGRPAVGERQDDHSRQGDPHCHPLGLAQPLPEHEHAQRHRDQRIDEVAQ